MYNVTLTPAKKEQQYSFTWMDYHTMGKQFQYFFILLQILHNNFYDNIQNIMLETILDQYYNLAMEIILVIIFIALKEQRRNESVKAARAVKEMFNVK